MEKRENFSRKRTAILHVLRESHDHPTADLVYARLKPLYPDLSLGTVYRNLRKFCETGKALSVGVVGGQERFDGTLCPHAHFTCTQCGAVMDVMEDFFTNDRLNELSRKTGLQLESAQVMFQGLCPACREKDLSQKSQK